MSDPVTRAGEKSSARNVRVITTPEGNHLTTNAPAEARNQGGVPSPPPPVLPPPPPPEGPSPRGPGGRLPWPGGSITPTPQPELPDPKDDKIRNAAGGVTITKTVDADDGNESRRMRRELP